MKWLLILWIQSTGAVPVPPGHNLLHPIYYSAYGTMETKQECHQTGEMLLRRGWGVVHSGMKPYSVRAYMCVEGNDAEPLTPPAFE